VVEKKTINMEKSFKCCRNKDFANFICIVCCNVFHPSCIERLPNVVKLGGFKIFCSLECKLNQDDRCKQLDSLNAQIVNLQKEISNKNTYIAKLEEDCRKCNNVDKSHNQDFVDATLMYEDRIKALEVNIGDKDAIIKYQDISIKSLSDQVDLLKKVNVVFGPCSKAHSVSRANQDDAGDEELNKETRPVAEFSQTDLSRQVETQKFPFRTMQTHDNSNTNRPAEPPSNATFASRLQRRVLVGNCRDTNGCPFRASSLPLRHFHATNFEPAVEPALLSDYLKNFAPDVCVVKLNSRNPSKYSSFKISVPINQVDKLLNCEIWPDGITLNKFFLPKKSSGDSTQPENN
jgi:hypothetical protein